jgi:hypothetical protein
VQSMGLGGVKPPDLPDRSPWLVSKGVSRREGDVIVEE